jgi:hypothetical protein
MPGDEQKGEQMQTTAESQVRSPDDFDEFAEAIRDKIASAKGPFFTTNPKRQLWEVYLDSFPDPVTRQVHNCHACKRFIERYGGLVTIDGAESKPAIWGTLELSGVYAQTAAILAGEVEAAPVSGVFYSKEPRWGEDRSPKGWTHFCLHSPSIHHHPLQTPRQAMAEKREEHAMLCRGLAEFSIDVVRQACTVLRADALYRGEKFLGVAEWLLSLHESIDGEKNRRRRDNRIWHAVATAPVGWCHVKQSMIGTLLEDLANKVPFDECKRRFADKMHPLQYQRPSALPTDANIAQAEKIVGALKSVGALERRYAKLEDVEYHAIWVPAPIEKQADSGEVFGHLKQQRGDPADLGGTPTVMTWEKFARKVLPAAEAIDLIVPHGHSSFAAFVTAVNPEAPPILQWDREGKRNTVSWYLWSGGSPASRWGLTAGARCRVTAVVPTPARWDTERPCEHQGRMVVCLLDGARQVDDAGGLALFPEILRSEYHSVRRTIEAHSRAGVLACRADATACGIEIEQGSRGNYVFAVKSGGAWLQYKIDRWD